MRIVWGRGVPSGEVVDPDALAEWWDSGGDEDLRWRDGVGYSAAYDDEWDAWWWRDEQLHD
jgi:hypothetical protein